MAHSGNFTGSGSSQCHDKEGCSPPKTSLNSVATGAYSLGWETIPARVFIRAILDMFVLIASVCSNSMQNVKKKKSRVIVPSMNMMVV